MKLFFVKLIFFLLPLLTGFFLLEKKLFTIPNSYNKKKQNLEEKGPEIKVLVSGSSQALYGINPAFFSVPAYNIANSSQSLYYDSAIVLNEIEKLSLLKCLLITVSYFSLYYRLEDSEEAWRIYYYYQFWRIDNNRNRFDIRKYSSVALYTPGVTASLFFNRFKTDFTNGILDNGYIWRDSSGNYNNINEESGRERVKFHNSLIEKGSYEDVSRICENLVRQMTRRGIKVVLVIPPVFETYSKYLNPQVLLKNQKFFKNLCADNNALLFDFSQDKRFEKRDFLDNDHLNFIGAQKFSTIINNEILGVIFSKI